MNGLVDALAHLEDARVHDRAAVLHRAEEAGVAWVISAGTDPLEDPPALDVGSVRGVRVRRAFGIHPRAAEPLRLDAQLARLEALLALPDVVALGECGLDGRDGMPALADQERAFFAQLALADAHGLPLLLHQVWATEPFLRILERHGAPKAGGMLHGFTGPAELVERYLALGLSVSFGGLVTEPRARRCREAALRVPRERLLVESDTPDHPPLGFAGKESEPAALVHTLAALAALRGEPVEALAHATADNARRLFFLPEEGPRLAG